MIFFTFILKNNLKNILPTLVDHLLMAASETRASNECTNKLNKYFFFKFQRSAYMRKRKSPLNISLEYPYQKLL